MQIPDGTKFNAATHVKRLLQSFPPSYTLWKDGTTYRAESNISGGTDYSGTDATTVIQNAIDAIASSKGLIRFRSGTFETGTLTPKNGVSYIGEGKGATVLKLKNATNDYIFKDDANDVEDIFIGHMTLDGNSANNTGGGGIYAQLKASELAYLNITDCAAYGAWLKVADDTTGRLGNHLYSILTESCNIGVKVGSTDNKFFGLVSHSNTSHGVEIATGGPGEFVSCHIWGNGGAGVYGIAGYIEFHACQIEDNATHGISLYPQAGKKNVLIDGCRLWKNSNGNPGTSSAIYINATDGNELTKVVISDCIIFDDQGSAEQKYPIKITKSGSGAIGEVIIDNVIAWGHHTSDLPQIDAGITYQIGKYYAGTTPLQNSGITGAIATGATVTHGLAGTPTTVTVTAAESGPTDIYVSAVGATTFVINYGGGGTKTFYWRAEHKP